MISHPLPVAAHCLLRKLVSDLFTKLRQINPIPNSQDAVVRSDRGITTAFNYVLLLGITTLLLSTLIVGVSGLVSNQQTDAIHAEFKVYGNQLASDISTASYLGSRIDDGTVELTSDLPQRVVGNQYTITVSNSTTPPELTLETDHPDVIVTVSFHIDSGIKYVEEGSLNGGPIEITYNADSNTTVLSDD